MAFRCPICASTSYAAIQVRRPSGHWYRTPFYSCAVCSVMFEDPVRFTQRRLPGDGVHRAPEKFHDHGPRKTQTGG